MKEKEKILKRLKEMGLEISKQNNRSTADVLFGITDNYHCFSFFENDVLEELTFEYRYNKEENKDFGYSNYNADRMNELRKLLIELCR